jgi:crotonobetainyl-CoA:carnitine CoA-transferase CaiB-like acyl-CoA transferase
MVLKGIRVLDFGRYVAGPYCATLLADLGAEVIRVERLQGSEDRYLAPVTDKGEGAMFLHINRNKLGMTLNPMKPEGREVVAKLVAKSDIVIANLPQESLNQMGLDYDTLKGYKPDIIVASSSAFGSIGPYAKRTGFDGVAQAMCGNAYLTGSHGQPTKSFASWVDFSTAIFAFSGVMAALMHKNATGRGQLVETNLLRSAMTIFHVTNMEQYLIGKNRVASGNVSQFGGPGDIVKTRDGYIILSVLGFPLFERWARLMSEEHWLKDHRFTTDADRAENGGILSERTQAWASRYTNEQALKLLEEAKIPAGPVLSPKQVFEDKHVQESNMMQMVSYPGVSQPIPMATLPVSLSALDTSVRFRPPQLGEHTNQVMASLGYSSVEISELRDKHVI